MPHSPAVGRAARFAGVAAAYFLASLVGVAFVVQPEQLSVFWPAGGLLFGFLLVQDRRRWADITAAAFVGNLTANLAFDHTIAVAVGFSAVNAVEPLAIAWAIGRFRPGPFRLDRLADVVWLFAVPIVVSAGTALAGAGLVTVGLGAPWYWGVWKVWLVADALGVILFAPLVLAWANPDPDRKWGWVRGLEVAAALSLLAAVVWAIFASDQHLRASPLAMSYPVFPVLLWVSFRHGLRGSAVAVALVGVIVAWGTLLGGGPVGDLQASVSDRLLISQGFSAAVCLTALLVTTTLRERRATEGTLRASEERFRLLFEQSSDAHLLFDDAGIFDCNAAAIRMLRCADKAAVMSLHPAVLSPEVQPDGRRSLEKSVEMDATARRRGYHRFDWVHRRMDGDEFPCEVTLTPVTLSGRRSPLLVVWHELTERLRAEADLRESEERFRAAMEGSLHAVFFLVAERRPDGAIADFRFTELNGRCAAMIARAREDVIGRRLCELLPVNRTGGFFDKYARVVATGEPLEEEFPIAQADGIAAGWLHHQVVRVGDGVVVTAQDVTDRKQAEEALLESESRFRSAFEDAAVGMALVGLDGRWLRVNRSLCAFIGYDEAELLATDFQTLTHPADLDADLEFVGQLLAGSLTTYQMEKRYVHKDGHLVWVLLAVSLVRGGDGSPLYFVSQIKDVTDRKRAAEALLESEEQYRSVVEALAEGIVLQGADGRIIASNERASEILGLSRDQIAGRTSLDPAWHAVRDDGSPFPGEDHPAMVAVRTGRPVFNVVMGVRTPAGAQTWMTVNAVPIRNPGDSSSRAVVASFHDITESRHLHEVVRASLREKEVLLKEIHHRVKNNLQIVSTLLDLQSEYTADPQAREMFEESRGRVRSMALIHERLYRSTDLARVDFGEYIRQLADDLYRTYKVSGADIRLDLAVDVPPLPLDLAIPCGLLLNELMSNCFKHAFPAAAEGCIRVDLRPAADGTSVLTVADDGAGFPAGTDFRNTHSFGLQLVNTLVEQLDGEIALTAVAGTTFTVRFPTAKGPPPDRTPAP